MGDDFLHTLHTMAFLRTVKICVDSSCDMYYAWCSEKYF